MSKFSSVLCLIMFLFTHNLLASIFSCEADCGVAASRSCAGGMMHCPYYHGYGSVYAEGETLSLAFETMAKECEDKGGVLHDGFIRNDRRAVMLNTNFRRSDVCQMIQQ